MTKYKPVPPVHMRWKKGQSGNPGGKPKIPDDIKETRSLNQYELERIINRYLHMTKGELVAAIKNDATPMMEVTVASIVLKAASGGDHLRLDFILNRLIGKVKDKVQIEDSRVEIKLAYANGVKADGKT